MTTAAHEDDDDMGAYWRDVKAAQQAERANRRECAPDLLESAGLKFESKNGDAHLIVTGLGRTVDFWPGTGRWIDRNSKRKGFGVRNVIDALTPEGTQQ